MRIIPKDAPIGAMVLEVSLSEVPSNERLAEIEAALARYGVLIFPNQRITPAEQIAFSRAFAALEPTTRIDARLDGHPDIFVVGNTGKRIVSFAPADGSTALEWHADHMHLAVPARASLLYALDVPTSGGDTLFACMSAAYEALTETEREQADGLIGVHSAAGLQAFLKSKGAPGAADGPMAARPESVRWPLVRAHPLTGRKSLYFGSAVTIGIDGWAEEPARAYLNRLENHATAERFRYRHCWKPGDAVLWDNRQVLHAGTPYDVDGARRRLHRTTFREDRPIAPGFGPDPT